MPLILRQSTAGTIRLLAICALLSTLLWPHSQAWGQAADAPAFEAITEYLEPDEDTEHINEHLAFQLSEPLDVNRAGADDLGRIPLLSPALALNIVRHRQRHGPFPAVDSLASVVGMTPELLYQLRPFLATEPPDPHPGTPGRVRYDLLHSVRRRLPYSVQTDSNRLYDTPYRILTRLSAVPDYHLRFSVTLESDPGEGMRWDPEAHTYGYDFVSGHLLLRNTGIIRKLVAGDFAADFGQGLVLSRGGTFGKSGHPVWGIARSGAGILPYRSSDEARFFRGIAATLQVLPHLEFTILASRRHLDARLTRDDCPNTSSTTPCIAWLSATGLHRTRAELDRKSATRSDLAAAALQYTRSRTRVGIVGYRNTFAYDFQRSSGPDLLGTPRRSAGMASIYAHHQIHDAHLFAEIGGSPGGALGGIGGVQWMLGRSAEAIVLVRHYPPSFLSRYGFAFGERTGASRNETGYYTGLVLRVHPSWTLSAAFDQYRFPWLRHGIPRPSGGYDIHAGIAWQPRQWFNAYAQVRSDQSENGAILIDPAGRATRGLTTGRRISARLHFESKLSHSLRVRARLESVQTGASGGSPHYGILLYHDVRWAPSPRFRIDVRLAYFDTDGYEARVYAFENGVAYAMSVPAFYGQGQRSYVVVSGKPFAWLTLQAKYGSTHHTDPPGSGAPDPISGGARRDLHALVRVRI